MRQAALKCMSTAQRLDYPDNGQSNFFLSGIWIQFCWYNDETLPFCSEPKYIGVKLDRSLTCRRHLESLRKLTIRAALLF